MIASAATGMNAALLGVFQVTLFGSAPNNDFLSSKNYGNVPSISTNKKKTLIGPRSEITYQDLRRKN
jgi:hypothetical protein